MQTFFLLNKKFIIIAFSLLLLLTSCVSKKDIIYLQDLENLVAEQDTFNSPLIQSNDILLIKVFAMDEEAAAPFNFSDLQFNQANTVEHQLRGYLVSKEGTIEFPQLGTVKVAGLTRVEVSEKLKKELSDFIKDPIVNITISNFEITILGEVKRPGTYRIDNERITFLEAIAMAGDLTILGKRKNIILLREENGIKTHTLIDITSSEFINSPYYYLKQNDVIYVEPNSTRVTSAANNRNLSVYISIASSLLSLYLIITTRL